MEFLDDPADPRLVPYLSLKGDRGVDGPCIAEGPLLVERLLKSGWEMLSVLVSDRHAARFVEQFDQAETPLLVLPESMLQDVVGFAFHRGVLAAARRPPLPDPRTLLHSLGPRDVVVLCPEINSPENLGAIFRIAGGFGVAGVVLGPRCCDPYSRRTLRVSMGSALGIPICASRDLRADMTWLAEVGVDWWAAVCEPPAEDLAELHPQGPTGLVLGTEADGLDPEIAAACARRVTIPMQSGFVDSLNVAVAAGIFLHALTNAR